MKQRLTHIIVLALLMLQVALPQPLRAETTPLASLAAAAAGPIVVGDVNAIGELLTATGGMTVKPALRVPAMLAKQDYLRVYAQAKTLLDTGTAFRLNNLQLPPSCKTLEECKLNYQNFNNGLLYNGFCSDYDQINLYGYCPGDTPETWPQANTNIRGQLARARVLFGFLAFTEPPDLSVELGGVMTPLRQIGAQGVLSATRELANIHLIFGNEFMVDAIDYRFGGNDPRADQIINEELSQLQLAHQQFELAFDALTHAFNSDLGGVKPSYIGDFFTEREYKLFGILSERMVSAIGEMADRYRQLGRETEALALYSKAFANQYVQALALAQSAEAHGQNFLLNGGWEMLNQMGKLRARAQVIHSGVNPFGFVDSYVPLQTYSELRELTQRDFLRDATEDENRAETTQRDFDQNRTSLNSELQNLRLTYDNRLLEICGVSADYARTCEGGLMQQNVRHMENAYNRIRQVYVRMSNLTQQVEIEQARNQQVISLTLVSGDKISAVTLAKGIESARRTSYSVGAGATVEVYGGVENKGEASFGLQLPPIKFKAEAQVFAGVRASVSGTAGVTTVWDPDQEALAKLDSELAVYQAVNQAAILNANSEATVRTLLLQQAELAIEKDIALTEWNRLSDEHNHLVQQYQNWLNLRTQARNDLIDSYLTNPAFRLLRDQSTLEASRSIDVAAQFAYLTAKAMEYEFLVPFPKLGDIFKARTADDVDNFLNDLEAFRVALGSPGQRNRYPYQISLARDLLGFNDQSIDPNNTLTAAQRAAERMKRFQSFLQTYAISDSTGAIVALEVPFTTSVLDNRIFSASIWNNRIAGVGLPADVPGTQGLSLNLLTRQFGDIGTPEVQLTHGGQSTYRTATGAIVNYIPENARLAGYVTPAGFPSQSATATILANVNGNGRGAPTSAFFNRSVAASHWVLRVDLRSPFNKKLELNQLEDIELNLDTTGVALTGSGQPGATPTAPTTPTPTQPSNSELTSYTGLVNILRPTPLSSLDLAIQLGNVNGLLSGKVNPAKTQGIDAAVLLTGQITSTVATTATFSLVSGWFTGTVAGRAVQRQFRLVGFVDEQEGLLSGQYQETITGFSPKPMVVEGSFLLSRPGHTQLPPGNPGPLPPPVTPQPASVKFYLPIINKSAAGAVLSSDVTAVDETLAAAPLTLVGATASQGESDVQIVAGTEPTESDTQAERKPEEVAAPIRLYLPVILSESRR